MSEGLERLKMLEAEGFSVTKTQELEDGSLKLILTNIQSGAKKVVVLSADEKATYESRVG